MERSYPAIEVTWPAFPGTELIEQLIASVGELGPTAVDERASGVVLFFNTAEQRDHAVDVVRAAAAGADIRPLWVSDESWAERSQASLEAIRVGRVVLAPPWRSTERSHDTAGSRADDIVITIVPSMGFGTGHHASTRLCLALMQDITFDGRTMLDIGTGSGALALAAWRLGARHVTAIDNDPDALTSASENVALNGAAAAVELRLLDVTSVASPLTGRFDVITANLTGALLTRSARVLASALAPGGTLIVSGVLEDEAPAVARVFADYSVMLRRSRIEDGWVGLHLEMTSAAQRL